MAVVEGAVSDLKSQDAPLYLKQRQTNLNTYNKDKVMKMQNTVVNGITAVTQSKWIRPALMTLALFIAVFGVAGCHTNH